MHLADGVLSSVPVAVSLNLCGALGAALVSTRSRGLGMQVAWTGTLAAFVLAVQALNLPLLPGASAHAMGAGLLTLALGPAPAILAMIGVLAVQALLLADGGITVLGINVLNMAVIPVLTVQLCRRAFGASRRGLMAAAVVGTTLGSTAGAASLTLALVYGAGAPLPLTASWLIGVQALAGLAEGVLTAFVVRHLYGRAPALIAGEALAAARWALDAPRAGVASADTRPLMVAACAIVVVLALLPLASSNPDALELVLDRLRTAR
jgi:cobalt/nickel transport system permease protein